MRGLPRTFWYLWTGALIDRLGTFVYTFLALYLTRARHFTSLLSVKLHTDTGERWVEGTVFGHDSLRLVSVRGIDVEAPLGGTMLIIRNDDQPGVIGEVGTILGRHRVNIANFALGRGEGGAIGIVNVDDLPGSNSLEQAMDEIRRVSAIRDAWVIRL